MIKLHLFAGRIGPAMGLIETDIMGHLYSDANEHAELGEAAKALGLHPGWLQCGPRSGLYHYDLWGARLRAARRKYPTVCRAEFAQDLKFVKEGYAKRGAG